MKHFPATCIDNFYSDPDAIRNFALAQEYTSDPTGRWPGKRSKPLHILNRELFDTFCDRFFSVFFDLSETNLNWVLSSEFHIIENLDDDKNSIKNKGWIHYDDSNAVLAGIIYLNKNPDPDSGTSIFRCIDESVLQNYHNNGPWVETKKKFYLQNIDENYTKSLQDNNDAFVETARFQNVYNRLVAYDCDVPHRFNSCYSPDNNDPRLVQVIFVNDLRGNFKSPLERVRSIQL